MTDWLKGDESGALPTWPGGPSWNAGRFILTDSGQSAIALAAQIWGLGAGDEVLVPAYNCGSEISPLVATGARITMYRVDGEAQIDMADLLRRVNRHTRVVYVTHYFGRISEIPGLSSFCRKEGIKLLEDCALSMFSAGTGCSGDAVVFSLRKSLAASNGGILWMPRGLQAKVSLRRPALGATARGLAPQLESWLKRTTGLGRPARYRLGATSTRSIVAPSDLPDAYYRSADLALHRGSRFAMGLLRRTDPATVVFRRRQNFTYLRQLLADTPGVALLWKEAALPAGLCPLGLPILTDDKALWCKRLQDNGIFVPPWWAGRHRDLDWSEFPEALDLKSRLLLLPVHQELTECDMNAVARVVRSLAAGWV